MGMGSDDAVQLPDAVLLHDGVHGVGIRCIAAVNQHCLPTAEHQGGIGLPYIEKDNLQVSVDLPGCMGSAGENGQRQAQQQRQDDVQPLSYTSIHVVPSIFLFRMLH